MTIAIKRIDGRHWNGNGFGYTPAKYGVYHGTTWLGTIAYGAGFWTIYAFDPEYDEYGKRPIGGAYKLKDAKDKAREYFA